MTAIDALTLVARLLAVVSLIHGVEFLWQRRELMSVWKWRDLETEIGPAFGGVLSDHAFTFINIMRLGVAATVLVMPTAVGLTILFLLHVLTLVRFLGTFNGGSDSMTLLLLWSTSLALALGGSASRIICWYIVFQLCLSYVRAGWVKLKNRHWRSGLAPRVFISSGVYESTSLSRAIARGAAAGAWVVIIFELSFPLSLINPQIAGIYITAGFVFHLVNAYLFGLNRFVFAWLAAYPALYFCSQGAL